MDELDLLGGLFDGIVETTQLLFNIYGESGANATGVMPGGLFVSDDSYLVALSSINQSESVEYGNENINGMDREIRDVYLLATDKETLEQKHYNITIPKGAGATVDTFGQLFIKIHGLEEFKKICKYNFKNTEKVLYSLNKLL